MTIENGSVTPVQGIPKHHSVTVFDKVKTQFQANLDDMCNAPRLERFHHAEAYARYVDLTNGSIADSGDHGLHEMAAHFLRNSILQNPTNREELVCAKDRLSELRGNDLYRSHFSDEGLESLKDTFTHNFSRNLVYQYPSAQSAREAVKAYREVKNKDAVFYKNLKVFDFYFETLSARVLISSEERSIADKHLNEGNHQAGDQGRDGSIKRRIAQ